MKIIEFANSVDPERPHLDLHCLPSSLLQNSFVENLQT